MTSPCMQCGACCATFRVAFYWAEAGDARQGLVPTELTRKIDSYRVSMIGTDTPKPRCLALHGDIGTSVCCTIYAQRPSPCREFDPYDADGNVNPRCNAARARWQVPPLEPILAPARERVDVRLPVGMLEDIPTAANEPSTITVVGPADLVSAATDTTVQDEGSVLH